MLRFHLTDGDIPLDHVKQQLAIQQVSVCIDDTSASEMVLHSRKGVDHIRTAIQNLGLADVMHPRD